MYNNVYRNVETCTDVRTIRIVFNTTARPVLDSNSLGLIIFVCQSATLFRWTAFHVLALVNLVNFCHLMVSSVLVSAAF